MADPPMQSIYNDQQLDAAIAVIDRLLDQRELTPGAQDHLDVLSDLVERYEDEHIPIPEVRGVEMLRYLMEANDLKQADLVSIFGTKSIVSEVLSEKRSLALSHIQGLSTHFGLPANVFLDEPED
jgi:HTH-type transcriptional regulator / antitoxin HigA